MALAAPESFTSYKQERKYLIFGVVTFLNRNSSVVKRISGCTYQQRTACKNGFFTSYKQERKYLIFDVCTVLNCNSSVVKRILGCTYQQRTACKNGFFTSYKQERKYLIFGVETVLVIGTKISDFWSSYGTELQKAGYDVCFTGLYVSVAHYM